MKKLLTILVSVLIIGALFISCSQQVNEDKLGSVSISLDSSRELKATVTSSVTSIDDLVWYYTAVKTSGLYATGQKNDLTMIPAYDNNSEAGKLTTGTSLYDFSTGWWKFSFYGFNSKDIPTSGSPNTANAVYFAKDIPVEVKDTEDPTTVNIALSVGNIAKGKVIFTGLSVDLSDLILRTGGTLSLIIKQNGVAITDENIVAEDKTVTFVSGTVGEATSYALTYNNESSFTLSDLDPGTYTFVFSVSYTNGDTIEIANEEWQVTVNNGTVVTFTGDVIKTESKATVVIGEVTGETKGEATIAPNSLSQAQSYTVAVSPASVADPESVARTTVSFPAYVLGSVITEGAEETLTSSKVEIKVTDTVEASTTFTVTGVSANAFAGINLDLYKTVTTTSSAEPQTSQVVNPVFAEPVIVETYIAKGLTGVTVEYQAQTGDTATSHPVASTDPELQTARKADVYATDNELGNKVGYSQQSGLLRFTTTHFSEFAVGAEQNVYDKTTNTAYKLCEEGANKGKLLKAAGDVFDAVKTDEYVLLDSTKANLVHDDIDVFNADYNWTVIHAATDLENTTDFAGGYGTKIEPYLIDTATQMANISNMSWYYYADDFYYNMSNGDWSGACSYADTFDTGYYYYKVKETNKVFECSGWKSIYLDGSFNGNGCTFESLGSPLFDTIDSNLTAIVCNFTADCNIISQTGRAAICSLGAARNMSLHDIKVTGYIEGQGQTAGVIAYPGSGVTTFERVNVSADILALGDKGAAVFVINPYQLLADYGGDENSKLVFDDCHFTGHLVSTDECKFFYVHTIKVPVEIRNIVSDEYGDVVNTYNRYALASQSSIITKGVIDISAVASGRTFEINKLNENAVKCTVTVAISPNGTDESGSFTGVYLRDKNLELANGVFTTANVVKLTSAYVNDTDKPSGLCDLDDDGYKESYNILSSVYGTTHNGGHLSVIQYDSDGNVVGFAQATLFGATQNN